MRKKWVLSLIGLGLSLAKILNNKAVSFSFQKRYERLKLPTYPSNQALRFGVVSDFKGGDRLNDGKSLAESLLEENLDFVVLMRSLFHKKNKNEEVTAFLNALGNLPVVYAPKKSSKASDNEAFYYSELSRSGIKILENTALTLNFSKCQVSLLGLLEKRKNEDSDDYEAQLLPNLKESDKGTDIFKIALGNHLNNFHLFRLLDADLIVVGEVGKRRDYGVTGILKRRYWGLKKVNKRKFYLKGVPLLTVNGFLQGYFLPKWCKNPEVLIVELDKMSNLNKKS